jgi:hypothetical protein
MPGDRDEARRLTAWSVTRVCFWTGRLDANKDPLTMLAAFDAASAVLPDARLYCCFGDAPMLADVERRIAASDLLARRRDVARPSGRTTSWRCGIEPADFFVQMSHREGRGIRCSSDGMRLTRLS